MRVGDQVPQLHRSASGDVGGLSPLPTGGTSGCGREAGPDACDRVRVVRGRVLDGQACSAPTWRPVAVRLTYSPNLVPLWESYRMETKKSLQLACQTIPTSGDTIRTRKTARMPDSARALVRCD